MKVLVAIDSFKGSVSSKEIGEAVLEGIRNTGFDNKVVIKSLSDGGEGLIDSLVDCYNGEVKIIKAHDPLMRLIKCEYGLIKNLNLAIIEIANIVGLPLLKKAERNPMLTTTYGVGEIIIDAIKEGCRNFVIGIGGSATSDAGVGMLKALGFRFLDKNGLEVSYGANGLKEIVRIDKQNVLKEVFDCSFEIACDVDNPLFGEQGAAYVYGPQKGATDCMIKEIDQGLVSFSQVVNRQYQIFYEKENGVGAAGGLGYGFISFLNSKLKSGIELVMDKIELEKEIINTDLVITGEGCLDFQSSMGKAPVGVSKLAKKHSKKVIAIAGSIGDGASKVHDYGIDAYFCIHQKLLPLEEAMKKEITIKHTKATIEEIFRLINFNY